MITYNDILDKLGLPKNKAFSEVDLVKQLKQKAKETGLDWKSISDMLFLLGTDNSRQARIELAKILNAPADVMNDSARMNTWLHKNVIKEIAKQSGPPPPPPPPPPPITSMTTYEFGDDRYDESFSIDTADGEFLGEYGVGISETVEVGPPKKVAALEIWLFDKNDVKTATKILMSEYAYKDAGISAKLKPKGELVLAKQGEKILLKTSTLQYQVTVVDMEYGTGAMHPNSFFQRIALDFEKI